MRISVLYASAKSSLSCGKTSFSPSERMHKIFDKIYSAHSCWWLYVRKYNLSRKIFYGDITM